MEELATEPPLTAPPRILIVDDDDSVRDVISVLLKEEGYNCVVASGAEMALDLGGGRRDAARHQRHEDAGPGRPVAARELPPALPGHLRHHAHRLRRHRGGGGLPAPRRGGLPAQAAQADGSHPRHRAGAGQAAHRAGAQALPEEAGAQGARPHHGAALGAAGHRQHLPEHAAGAGGGAGRARARDVGPLAARGEATPPPSRDAHGHPRRGAGGDRPRRAAARHREDRRAGRGAAQAGQADPGRVDGDAQAPGHRLPDDPVASPSSTRRRRSSSRTRSASTAPATRATCSGTRSTSARASSRWRTRWTR